MIEPLSNQPQEITTNGSKDIVSPMENHIGEPKDIVEHNGSSENDEKDTNKRKSAEVGPQTMDSTKKDKTGNDVSVSEKKKRFKGAGVKSEKLEPDLTLHENLTNGSAAAWMSALATSVGQQKSVGTGNDVSNLIMDDNNLDDNKLVIDTKVAKEVKVEADLSPSVISKAIIKTPVKIKNNGDDDSIRFMTQYMCRYCAQRFDDVQKMQEHVQEHIKGKHNNHTCSVCGKEYRTPSKLQRHVRVHSGERPYACTVCGRRFTRSDHVKQHMKVHLPPQELNNCRLCGTRFMKRQSLQLHLQQAHLVNQLFACHRCGEAYESLEQLNSHTLTHDVILNSMKAENKAGMENAAALGLAKFSVGVALRPLAKKEPKEKKTPVKEKVATEVPAPAESATSPEYNYILNLDAPEQEDITQISDKLIADSIEEESKRFEEIKKHLEEHAKLMAQETIKKQEEIEQGCSKMEEEKIAAAFNLEKEDNSMELDDYNKPAPAVLMSEDGMSMYISAPDIMKMNEETEASSHNGSENDNDDSEMKEDKEKEDRDDENKGSKSAPNAAGQSKGQKHKIGPLWFKNAQEIHRSAALKQHSDKILNIPKVDASAANSEASGDNQPKMVSCIKPNINELLKAKVEQNKEQPLQHTQIIGMQGMHPNQPVPIAPRQVQQYILVTPPQPTIAQVTPQMAAQPKDCMLRCEHCCIWFEDRAMCMLHNTLHSADKTDPFTCRKCYKKMGNRLEFMAHLVWHLEPNMDI